LLAAAAIRARAQAFAHHAVDRVAGWAHHSHVLSHGKPSPTMGTPRLSASCGNDPFAADGAGLRRLKGAGRYPLSGRRANTVGALGNSGGIPGRSGESPATVTRAPPWRDMAPLA